MPDFKPGDRVRIIADGEVVQLPDGLGVLLDDQANTAGRSLFPIDTFDVRPASSTGSEWAVVCDLPSGGRGALPNFPPFTGEEFTRRVAADHPGLNPAVYRRQVDRGPWEKAPDV